MTGYKPPTYIMDEWIDKTDGWLNKKEMNEQIDGRVGEVHIEELEEDYK